MAPIFDFFKKVGDDDDSWVMNIAEGMLDVAGYTLKGLPLSAERGSFDASAPFDASRSVWHSLATAVGDGVGDDPNPYAVAYAYGGLESGDSLMAEFSSYKDKIDALSSGLTHTTLTAPSITDTTVETAENFAALEADYDITAGARFDAEIERYLAGMFALNAHTASPFYLKLGDMMIAKSKDAAAFRAKLRIDLSGRQAQINFETKKANMLAVIDSNRLNLELYRLKNSFVFQQSEMYKALYFTHFSANTQRYDQDVDLNVKAVTWAFDNNMRLAQMVVPTAGMPLSEPRPSKLQQGLASALSVGSNLGMSVGAVAGPAAGIVAALVGGAIGFGSQLL